MIATMSAVRSCYDSSTAGPTVIVGDDYSGTGSTYCDHFKDIIIGFWDDIRIVESAYPIEWIKPLKLTSRFPYIDIYIPIMYIIFVVRAWFYRRMLFSKSGFVGRVAKRRKGK